MRITALAMIGLFCLCMLPGPAANASTYGLDDGWADSAVGGTSLWWGNLFETDPQANLLTSVDVAFGYNWNTGGLGLNYPFTVNIFDVVDGDPSLGLNLLSSTGAGVTAANGFTFRNVDIADTLVSGSFLVALNMEIPGTWPGSIDLTTPSGGRSWVSFETVGGLPGPMQRVDQATEYDGVFMIRAHGEYRYVPPAVTDPPTPGSDPSGDDPIAGAPMPEPVTTTALLLAGAGLMGYLRRHRRV